MITSAKAEKRRGRPPRPSPLERLAGAVLLFHSAGPWVDEKAELWLELVGTREATNRALCDLARQLLANEKRRRERANLPAPSGDRAAAQPDVPAMRPGEAQAGLCAAEGGDGPPAQHGPPGPPEAL